MIIQILWTVFSALACFLAARANFAAFAALRTARETRAEVIRLAARMDGPGRTAELERATGLDLLELPPVIRTTIRTMRAVRRG